MMMGAGGDQAAAGANAQDATAPASAGGAAGNTLPANTDAATPPLGGSGPHEPAAPTQRLVVQIEGIDLGQVRLVPWR